MSREQIQVTVKVIVAHTDAHSCFFHPVIAERNTADYIFLMKRSIPLVHQQEACHRITGDKNIGPGVFIKVCGNDRHTMRSAKCVNVCLDTHSGKRPVSIDSVEGVITGRQAQPAAIYGDTFPVAISFLTRLRNGRGVELHIIRYKKMNEPLRREMSVHASLS